MFRSLKTAMFGAPKEEREAQRAKGAEEDDLAVSTENKDGLKEGDVEKPAENGVWENHGEGNPESPVKDDELADDIKKAAGDQDNTSLVTPAEEKQIDEMLVLLERRKEGDAPGVTATVPPVDQKEGESDDEFASRQETFRLRRALVRFLRARRHNVKEALKMFAAEQEWREENKVDTIFTEEEPFEEMYQCKCPHKFHGVDAQGHPVYFERTGLIRVEECLKYVDEDAVVRRHIKQMEHFSRLADHSSKKTKRVVEKCIIVMDLKNLPYGAHRAGLRIFKRTSNIDQNYYPERLHKMIMINAPLSFRGIWAMVKPWLNKVTQSKIEIVGGNYQDRLKNIIPTDVLPAEYGGQGPNVVPGVREYPTETPSNFSSFPKTLPEDL